MRKTVMTGPRWIDLERLAHVYVTSEDPDHPVESALTEASSSGWRASEPGEQTIRLLFDEPQEIHHIRLSFSETEEERTQEFVLRWSSGHGQPMREIVRQQWNFSPGGSTFEMENYHVELRGASILELTIQPDISGRERVARLGEWRLA
jgi:hypothetical protein